ARWHCAPAPQKLSIFVGKAKIRAQVQPSCTCALSCRPRHQTREPSMHAPPDLAIPDDQSSADRRRIAINKVGIKSIRHPVKVADKAGGVQHTVANFNMYVGLPHNFKGTHMSRFIAILNDNEREISVENFEPMLRAM